MIIQSRLLPREKYFYVVKSIRCHSHCSDHLNRFILLIENNCKVGDKSLRHLLLLSFLASKER